jgi:DNA repair exonuclease SbcCD ATPase subunit
MSIHRTAERMKSRNVPKQQQRDQIMAFKKEMEQVRKDLEASERERRYFRGELEGAVKELRALKEQFRNLKQWHEECKKRQGVSSYCECCAVGAAVYEDLEVSPKRFECVPVRFR